MRTVRIWALESKNDAKTVKCLAHKVLSYLQIGNLSVQTTSIRPTSGNALKKATQNYLKQDDCIIFIVDKDGPITARQRQKEQNSLINQVKQVIKDASFDGKVFFTPAVEELEAWLLTDCLGIFCYFASTRTQYREDCRDKVSTNQHFTQLVQRYQKSDTEKIIDTGTRSSGAKKHLTDFSDKILHELNPTVPRKNVYRERYRGAISPEVAEHVVVDRKTLRRNNSLRYFGEVLARFNS